MNSKVKPSTRARPTAPQGEGAPARGEGNALKQAYDPLGYGDGRGMENDDDPAPRPREAPQASRARRVSGSTGRAGSSRAPSRGR